MTFIKRLSWLTIALMVFSSVGLCLRMRRVYDKLLLVIFEEKFKEPIEILYLWASDLTLYRITSNHSSKVEWRMDSLKKRFKQQGHTMADIILIIHNHPPTALRKFSRNDIRAWRCFQDEGFTGNYYLYIQGLNVMYELMEDEDDS